MKILLVGNYPPPFGGISVHVQMLYRLLRARGIDCRVLNVDPRAPESHEYTRVRGYGDFLWRLLAAALYGIVHLHTNGHNIKSWMIACACAWIGRVCGRGSILTIHSGLAPDFIKNSKGITRVLIKLSLAPQSYVVCVNREIQAALANIGLDINRTLLLPAFLFDESLIAPLADDLVERLRRYRPLVSLVAFFRPEYGVELMIEALAGLAAEFPDIGCAVMGSGEGGAQLRALAAARGVAERIVWLGDLDHGQCLSVMKLSQLFVRPTRADGDAVSVREAVQLGVPVVASDVGCRPETVILFRRGDRADLLAQCARALKNGSAAASAEAANSGLSLLIDLYERIGAISPAIGTGYEQRRAE